MQEYIDLKVDFAKRNAQLSGTTLENVVVRSYDTAIKFRIEIADHVLDDTYDVKILSKYSCDKSQAHYKTGDNLEFLDGKLIYTPKVDLISQADYVRNYLYLSKDGLGLDMAQFNYEVDLSEIDKTALGVKLVYDQSYEALLTEFEQALEDYKLTLPKADSVRAEIDVIMNQFGKDGQAKLSQYDDDAQQVITDNQTAFGLAETGRQDNYERLETDRQNTYEQNEDNRNQASNQAVVDWEQGAGESLSVKLSSIQSTVDTSLVQTVANFNTRADGAIDDKLIEFDTKTDQVLSPIESAEALRVIAEQQRQIKIAQLEAQLEIINKLVMKQTVVMGVTWGRSSSPTLERIEVL